MFQVIAVFEFISSLVRPHSPVQRTLWACFLLVWLTPVSAKDRPAPDSPEQPIDIERLDRRLQEFSARFYPKLAQSGKQPKLNSIAALTKAVNDHRTARQPARAVAVIVQNMDTVERSLDTNAIIPVMQVLLEVNEWKTATRLYARLKDQGDSALIANASLGLVNYHFARHQWAQTAQLASSIGTDIPAEDYHHIQLMYGIALQRLQKHRAALNIYRKIPKTSRYYTAARLNMAIANIRQDWWTDAHAIIEELIQGNPPSHNPALTDRLYTVLGYSLLRQQYYRNSRDAFRNVGLNGPYTNRALLGIALTAAYQEDYVGALNAVTALQKKPARDLPVDEANLLMPFFYEKLNQQTTAVAGYAQAIKYYEERIAAIDAAMPADPQRLREQLLAGGPQAATVNQEVIDLDARLPKAFFDNFSTLASLQAEVTSLGDAALLRDYQALNQEYSTALQKAVHAALTEKKAYLSHYMSQSRFGLAAVHDRSTPRPE